MNQSMKTLIAALILIWSCIPTQTAFPQTNVGQRAEMSEVKPAKTLTVQVKTPDGKPLPNVTVVCIGPSTNTDLKGTTIEGGNKRVQTDAAGQFVVPSGNENIFLVIANDKGFSLSQSYDLTNHPTMVVRPWGRIEGARMNRNRPLANQRLMYYLDWRCIGSLDILHRFGISEEATTDAHGRFVFEHVPPMGIVISEVHRYPAKLWFGLQPSVEVKPGETTQVKIETQGRTVVGHIELGAGLANNMDLTSCNGRLSADMDVDKFEAPKPPKGIDTIEKRTKFWQDWYNSDAGRQYFEAQAHARFEFHADGSFIGEMCEPGKYCVDANIGRKGKVVAVLDKVHVTIPAGTDDRDVPFDIGKVMLKAAVDLKAGDVAPDFSVKTIDGQPFKLSDFRGKYVLLDFWATWCGPCVEEMPNLKTTYDTFGKDARFVMISLSLDPNRASPEKFVKDNGIGWTQVFLGEWSKDVVTPNYGVFGIPTIFLIGPDGKVLAADLQGPTIKEAVAAALASK
jgi:peroxiredoxin